MPQMMPMYWLLMIMLLTINILFIMSFMYFFMNYQMTKLLISSPQIFKWNWKW